MSLVGKELEVSAVDTSEADEVSSTDDEVHPPLSPATGAEALFMSGLGTSNISAMALASELRKNYRSMRSSSTVATGDFVSCVSNMDDLTDFYPAKETPGISDQPIYEFDENTKNTMSTSSSSTSPNVDEVKVDAAEHVYEGAKNVWGWGKQQMIISTFLGITEAIAGKVVSVVGTDLEEIDHNIKPQLTNLDNSILNPAIRAILGVIMNAAGKSEDIFKPIVVSILKPIGLLKDKKESVAPELTNSRTARVS